MPNICWVHPNKIPCPVSSYSLSLSGKTLPKTLSSHVIQTHNGIHIYKIISILMTETFNKAEETFQCFCNNWDANYNIQQRKYF